MRWDCRRAPPTPHTSSYHLSNESLTLMQLYRSNDYSWLDRLSMVANIFHQYPTALDMSLSHNGTDDQLPGGSPSIVTGDGQSVQSMSFLVSTFLVFDIMASASLKRDPILGNHETLIIQHAHMIETISGCDAQVFLAMLSTTRLAIWKHTMLAQRHLDVMELANRASVIKSLLMECLYRCSASARSHLTTIFSHATLIYLHVTVSGAHVGLPGLQDHVNIVLSSILDYMAFSSDDLKTSLGRLV